MLVVLFCVEQRHGDYAYAWGDSFTGGANNKPQQLLMVPEERRGMPVTGMHKIAALERRKTIVSSEGKESGWDCAEFEW
jgi:hypothetical protein